MVGRIEGSLMCYTFTMRFPTKVLLGSLSIFAIGLLAGSALAQRTLRASFPDIPEGSIAADSIRRFSLLGLLTGYESGLFGPNDALTRAQATLLLSRFEDRMIDPLRKQIEEMRGILDLGQCGDGTEQTGEECDDGNTDSEDGCSAQCLRENLTGRCAGGYEIGENFPSPDGCNTCVCMEAGVACTKKACPKPPSDPKPPLDSPLDPARDSLEESVLQTPPLCGNGVCEMNENVLPPHRRYHCPMDCTGEEFQRQCNAVKTEVLSLSQEETACGSSEDCVAVRQSCPHITCGIPVNKSSYPSIKLAMNDALDTCRREGMITECVLCQPTVAVCRNGICVLQTKAE